jgi:integrase
MAKQKEKRNTATLTLPDGKRKYFRAKTQDELKQKVARARLELGAGIDIADDTTVSELAQLWFDACKKPYLRPSSADSVLFVLNHYALPPWFGRMSVRTVRPLHVQMVMNGIQSYSQSAQRKTIQEIRSIFQFAVDNGLLVRTPCISTINTRCSAPEEKVPLTVEQSKMLLKSTEGTRAHLAVAILLGAGLRRGELCGLKWEEVDLENGVIHVRHNNVFVEGRSEFTDDLKTRAARRDIPVPLWLNAVLLEARSASKSEFVISQLSGKMMTPSSFKRLWDIVDARTTDNPEMVGKPIDARHPWVVYAVDRNVYPHLLRHTCITRWFESGLDIKEVQYLAGHATPDMTMRIYTHYDRIGRAQATTQKIREQEALVG